MPLPAVFVGADASLTATREGVGVLVRMDEERRLVRAVQSGDEAAFGSLVDRYMEPAFAIAISILGNAADAEDAVQSSFIRALERIDQLATGSPFGPWFYSVLRSTALNTVIIV